jgi:hypothetical protein
LTIQEVEQRIKMQQEEKLLQEKKLAEEKLRAEAEEEERRLNAIKEHQQRQREIELQQ